MFCYILELTCTCDERSIIVGWNNGFPQCKRCLDIEVPSADSRACLTCKGRQKFVSKKQCFGCHDESIYGKLVFLVECVGLYYTSRVECTAL